jgi:MarR family transcriptional regulator for hemolysin
VIQSSIPFCISWLARLMRTRFDARARTLGLTRAQWSMIATIRIMEGATQSELASALEINSVTAGRILDKLESAGWIERRANPADRRTNHIHVREPARPTLVELSKIAGDELKIATRGISEEEQAIALDVLGRMLANLNAAEQAISQDSTGALDLNRQP